MRYVESSSGGEKTDSKPQRVTRDLARENNNLSLGERSDSRGSVALPSRRIGMHDIISSVPTDHIVTLLVAERDRLNTAIEALLGTTTKRRGRPPGSKNGLSAVPTTPAKQGRTFTAAARKAQSKRMKAYWAAKKKGSK
jgi:hypothetical protein